MKFKKFKPATMLLPVMIFFYDSDKCIDYYRKITIINGNIFLDFIRLNHIEIYIDKKRNITTYNCNSGKTTWYNSNLDIIEYSFEEI